MFRFIAERMLISANVTDNTKKLFITGNGLNNARTTTVHDKDYKSFGVANFDKITKWSSVKSLSKYQTKRIMFPFYLHLKV